MGISGVLGYLREILPHEGAQMTAHTIGRNRERAIGVFAREGRAARQTAIGGCENRSFEVVRVTLLLRWGRDGDVAATKGLEIYEILAERDGIDFDGRVGFVRAVNAGPVWLGMDERGIFEFVIDFDVYIEKEEKNGISGK
ncbi:MAG: minor capsid protein [Defluviitaleaceae bacterium]|nr:minor capsid protein [Defluviitaleaceae bacterium]